MRERSSRWNGSIRWALKWMFLLVSCLTNRVCIDVMSRVVYEDFGGGNGLEIMYLLVSTEKLWGWGWKRVSHTLAGCSCDRSNASDSSPFVLYRLSYLQWSSLQQEIWGWREVWRCVDDGTNRFQSTSWTPKTAMPANINELPLGIENEKKCEMV